MLEFSVMKIFSPTYIAANLYLLKVVKLCVIFLLFCKILHAEYQALYCCIGAALHNVLAIEPRPLHLLGRLLAHQPISPALK